MEENVILDDFHAFKGFISDGVFVCIELLRSKDFINCCDVHYQLDAPIHKYKNEI